MSLLLSSASSFADLATLFPSSDLKVMSRLLVGRPAGQPARTGRILDRRLTSP